MRHGKFLINLIKRFEPLDKLLNLFFLAIKETISLFHNIAKQCCSILFYTCFIPQIKIVGFEVLCGFSVYISVFEMKALWQGTCFLWFRYATFLLVIKWSSWLDCSVHCIVIIRWGGVFVSNYSPTTLTYFSNRG